MNRPLALFLLGCLTSALSLAADAPAPSAPATPSATASSDSIYLFAYFRNEKDGLHLAQSTDGLNWKPLYNDKFLLKPDVGGKLMRDPCLQRGPDGDFLLVWTDSWTGQSIGFASSKDLIHWSAQQELPVMAGQTARESWAPEIRYDTAKSEYVIYWSSSTNGKDFKTWATTSKDLKTFTPAKIFFDPGFSEIDGTIFADDGGKFLFFFKHGGVGIQIATGDALQGPYKDTGTLFAYPGSDQWEAPWAMKIGGDYIVYADHFKSRDRMGAWRSHDLQHWEDITAQTTGLRGMEHGSVIVVPKSIITAIESATPASAPTPAAATSATSANP